MTPALGVLSLVAVAVLGYYYGYLRAGIAVGMFLVLLMAGIKFVRQMVETPAEPEPADVTGYGLKYVCEVCGLELRVERASKERAPSHCTEPMTLIREGGPPLRPL